MNLTEIQHRLDQSWSFIEQGKEFHAQAVVNIHQALQLLVNELAKIQPEHPELTSSDKLSSYSEQAFKDFTQLLAARCNEFSEKTREKETK